MTQEKRQVRANVPAPLLDEFEDVYDFHGAKSETIKRAFRNAVESKGDAIQRKIDEKTDELNDVKAERREINARIETLEDELSELQRRKEETTTTDAKAEARIDDLVDMVESGNRIVPGRNAVLSKVAQAKGISEDAAVELVRNRSAMELPDAAFRKKNPKKESEVNWRKCLDPSDNRWIA